jgi:hypothetical protein
VLIRLISYALDPACHIIHTLPPHISRPAPSSTLVQLLVRQPNPGQHPSSLPAACRLALVDDYRRLIASHRIASYRIAAHSITPSHLAILPPHLQPAKAGCCRHCAAPGTGMVRTRRHRQLRLSSRQTQPGARPFSHFALSSSPPGHPALQASSPHCCCAAALLHPCHVSRVVRGA